MRASRWVWWAVLAVGCGGPVDPPLVEAHRGGAGYWPENSASAVRGSIAAAFDGLEVDLMLTEDGEAVLSHDPWLDPAACLRADGDPMQGRLLIREQRLSDLVEDFVCGGLPDEEHPASERVSEPPMSYEALLLALQEAPAGLRVHLDLKVEAELTPPVEDWLEPVLDGWWKADLPQALVISANRPEVLRAFEEHARVNGRDLHSVLIFPLVPIGSSSTEVGLQTERDSLLGRIDYIDQIDEAHADGIAVNWEIVEKRKLLAAWRAGYETSLWTVNEPRLLAQYSRWPVDVLITDYPGSEP